MKIAVIGPGALGSLLAAGLSANTDHEVWLLDHDRDRAARLENSVFLAEEGAGYEVELNITADSEDIGSVDLVLLCVKSFAVEAALTGAASLFHPSSLLIAFQNGIIHAEIIRQAFVPGYKALGVSSEGATLLGPGKVSHRGRGQTSLGFWDDPGRQGWEKLEEAADLLAAAGFPSAVVADIQESLWRKLLVNAGINGLTVIYDCSNGELLADPRARELMAGAVREGAAVARAAGVSPGPDPVAYTEEVCRRTAGNISSMLQDIRRNRPTEIAAINGALAARAEDLGIEVPVNRMIIDKVREIEALNSKVRRSGNGG